MYWFQLSNTVIGHLHSLQRGDHTESSNRPSLCGVLTILLSVLPELYLPLLSHAAMSLS